MVEDHDAHFRRETLHAKCLNRTPPEGAPCALAGSLGAGHPRTAGPAHSGIDTWAMGLCLLPAKPKEASLCKHGHNRRKFRPSFEVEPHSSTLHSTGFNKGQYLLNEMAADWGVQAFSTLSEGRSHFAVLQKQGVDPQSWEEDPPSPLPHPKGLACCAGVMQPCWACWSHANGWSWAALLYHSTCCTQGRSVFCTKEEATSFVLHCKKKNKIRRRALLSLCLIPKALGTVVTLDMAVTQSFGLLHLFSRLVMPLGSSPCAAQGPRPLCPPSAQDGIPAALGSHEQSPIPRQVAAAGSSACDSPSGMCSSLFSVCVSEEPRGREGSTKGLFDCSEKSRS